MPMIDLTLARGALGDEAKRTLVERLTATVSRCVGMSDAPHVAATVWAFVDERPADTIHAGGSAAEAPRYRVRITVAAGALDDEAKSRLVAEVTAQVLEAEGSPNQPVQAARVWCHVHELADGNWGAAGRIWRLPQIAEFAGIDLDRRAAAAAQPEPAA